MTLISPQDRATLRTLFEQELQDDVTIMYFTQRESPLKVPGQECDYCKDTRQLLEELAAMSSKLHLIVKDFVRDEQEAQQLGITHIPAFLLQGHIKGTIRFFGIPAGYEFSTLVEDLLDVSKGTTRLSEKTREALSKVDHDVHLQVFVTPTCPYCPRAARVAHQMAVENEHISADVIEASEFIDLAQRYQIQGVPKTVINEHVSFVGALPEPRVMQEILHALEHQQM
jgi:glutaredoxin-like protein